MKRRVTTDPAGNESVVEWADADYPPELAVEDNLNGRIADALADLRAYRDTPAGAITNANTVTVVKLLCRVAIALIRLRHGLLDSPD